MIFVMRPIVVEDRIGDLIHVKFAARMRIGWDCYSKNEE